MEHPLAKCEKLANESKTVRMLVKLQTRDYQFFLVNRLRNLNAKTLCREQPNVKMLSTGTTRHHKDQLNEPHRTQRY